MEPEPVDARREIVVGVLADPDLPAAVAAQLPRRLPALVSGQIAGAAVRWRVEVVCDPFEALSPDYERLLDKARQRVRTADWDLAVCLTDEPLRDQNGLVVAEVGAKDAIAVLSLPALGGVNLPRRTRRLVAILVEHLTADVVNPDRPRAVLRDDPHLRRVRSMRMVASADSDISCEIVVTSSMGLLRLLSGMTLANRPWRLVWGLSGALGGALAGSAFGVFYSNIWSLADSLPPWRLILVAVGATVVHVLWIVFGHDLWEGSGASRAEDRPSTRLRTALTVTYGVLVFALALFALTLAASFLVVTPTYLSTVLGHPVGLGDYLGMALMGTVMGIIAGAVGSGLEDDATVHRVTYAHRRRERARSE